jgi:hypothetical protein
LESRESTFVFKNPITKLDGHESSLRDDEMDGGFDEDEGMMHNAYLRGASQFRGCEMTLTLYACVHMHICVCVFVGSRGEGPVHLSYEQGPSGCQDYSFSPNVNSFDKQCLICTEIPGASDLHRNMR